ncbi:MAG: PfkB family carbohydrate kinase [Planctomycetota bacterium]|nr:PfkB family carbohydrate kinase [Planctomycetota bacterium]
MLIVTGTIGIDTIHGPTGSADAVMGGSAAYFAAACSHLAPVRLVGLVGDDWPEAHRAMLESFPGIDLAGLETRAGGSTFRWGGRYEENMNHRETLFTHLGVVEDDPPAVPAAFADSRYVFLANSHPAVQAGMLDSLPDRVFTVCDTMDLWINVAHDDLLALLRRVDGLVLNDSEAELLAETRNVVSAGRRILDLGPSFVVIKKGEHGAILVHEDGIAAIPAFPASHEEVVDPTGAGDSFAGGMMAHLTRLERTDFEAIQESLAWGTVMASFTIGAFGLDGIRSADGPSIAARMDAFRAIGRIG